MRPVRGGAPRTRFTLPEDLYAAAPPEARGLARDEVRLLFAGPSGVRHAVFRSLGDFLRPGDLLVVNTSGTLPAAVDAVRSGQVVGVHFSTELDHDLWVVELRSPGGPLLDGRPGELLRLPAGATLTLDAPHVPGGRLWRARVGVEGGVAQYLARVGRPIRYGYVPRTWPLTDYQTVFALDPGSAEMPSAARPFTEALVTRLVSRGVLFAPLLLHTGVSSPEAGEPPYAERFHVPATTAALVNWVRAQGGRIIAVGTTAVRALESAVVDGAVTSASGWTSLVLGPAHPASVVDGVISGLHTPEASHLLLLEAVVGPSLVQQAYDAAVERRYLWHEFGDVSLLLKR
ncbi:S-adenosylmethionine:tRNA ribosyltransferase-isomerase [Amycolatopsis sp. FDAARGOS 1241]|uniref:S-adenosylmethionine:tRNA ribosyltransferase-isomerase n=1 Tax=Amycolatopsis sp. FDAARGOS 1241 TaxID=2778070 RepID=UPI00195135E0|nr:S-adenosylmethionine:tRNA ribosyltransferase-isomerase [Amycolatopsis sp. FDAARGOS 1241]QRP44656.1 S-adenosylmethionine:tRNA ribosyltransferase-isomerase [Amycolatopsis sp. FDAARGOS 1241]